VFIAMAGGQSDATGAPAEAAEEAVAEPEAEEAPAEVEAPAEGRTARPVGRLPGAAENPRARERPQR
jgi:hypothetical protein